MSFNLIALYFHNGHYFYVHIIEKYKRDCIFTVDKMIICIYFKTTSYDLSLRYVDWRVV